MKEMRYISTKNACESATVGEAVCRCLASDGGLYMPVEIPKIPKAFFNNIGEMSLREIAYVVATALIGPDVDAGALKAIVDESFNFEAPLVSLGAGSYALELFHGPTLTFKDYGARFMARLLRHFDTDRRKGPRKRTVLVATTGNSGASTANGMRGIEGVEVLVLYPKGVLSRMQMAQFITLGGNIHPIEVSGSIEDCKAMVRSVVADESLADYGLTGANSINIGRLIPQVAFSFHAYARLVELGLKNAQDAFYAMPCGNMSNVVAAMIAGRMGLPMGGIVGACNVNDALGRVMRGEDAAERPMPTTAPSLDVSKPSGLPRLLELCGGDVRNLGNELVAAPAVTDREIASTILRLRAERNYTIDPHGAAAFAALHGIGGSSPKVVYATGHPAKNLDIMTGITGSAIELPVQLTRFMSGKRHVTMLPPTVPALRRFIVNLYNKNNH